MTSKSSIFTGRRTKRLGEFGENLGSADAKSRTLL